MKLELLANETLLDLFNYLKGLHLLCAFYGLNSRFDSLLIVYFRSHPLNFLFASKVNFDIVCQQQLSSFTKYINSLYLSNDDQTSQQTKRFLAHNLTLGQFSHLQILKLGYLHSEVIQKILTELCHLSHLTHLYIIECIIQLEHIDTILRLPKLTHCSLHGIQDSSNYELSVISSSLRSFSLQLPVIQCLKNLTDHMPGLQHLSLFCIISKHLAVPSFSIPSLKTLKLQLRLATYKLDDLVQYLPNLYQLTVDVPFAYINGYQWERFITESIPKLQQFHLRMQFTLSNRDPSDEKQLDSILESFQDRFWIEEHQWFIRCHCRGREFYLYTLPHIFTDQTIPGHFGPSKSTCPDQSDHYLHDHVHRLIISQNLSSNDCSYNRFPNVRELRITIPTDNNFVNLFPTFNQLKFLIVSVMNDDPIARDQLQTLLDKAPRLFSLELQGVLLTELSSKSIRRLIFHRTSRPFDKLTCMTLSNSALGSQCEYLALSVDNGVIIPDLIHNMKNLRILQFNCEEYPVQEGFIEWLEQHLPPTCTISNGYTPYFTLWIC